MTIKKNAQIPIAVAILFCLYILNQIALFHDREFERAVRERMFSSSISASQKREKPIVGIIWKRDLEKVDFLAINFRDYKVKDIIDIRYFKNIKELWLMYSSAYYGDTSIYEEEHILDNLYKIKDFKHLKVLDLYHLKINEDIEAMFPDVEVRVE